METYFVDAQFFDATIEYYKYLERNDMSDFVYKNSNLNSHDLFLLAGFYYRANNINKFEKIRSRGTNHY